MTNIAFWIVIFCAVFRVAMVWSGLFAMALNKVRKIQWRPSMVFAFPEPFLLAGVIAWMTFSPAERVLGAPLAVMAGAMFGIGSVFLFLWSFIAYRKVGTGHYVDENHRVITTGPYALMRHPFYSSAFLCWIGVAFASAELWVAGLAIVYVAPAYWVYASSEERMMGSALGDRYEAYRKKVPMFMPRVISGSNR